jgi:hypothetical protein
MLIQGLADISPLAVTLRSVRMKVNTCAINKNTIKILIHTLEAGF